jgi:hypothetical protein
MVSLKPEKQFKKSVVFSVAASDIRDCAVHASIIPVKSNLVK